MKQYLILGATLAALLLGLLVVWLWHNDNTGMPDLSDPPQQSLAALISSNTVEAASAANERTEAGAGSRAAASSEDNQLATLAQRFDETHNVPVVFYGQVVDQDTNALQDVTVDLEILEQYMDSFPKITEKTAHLQRQTGADGRFEVSGLQGHSLRVVALSKDGYAPERLQKHYGIHGAQTGTFENPVMFTLWNTNVHESLITGDKSYQILPDGRHYAINLIKGTITEGSEGDLVVWIKRPESEELPQKYAWSCGMAAPGGGLEPEEGPVAMSRAPLGKYTNVFTLHREYNTQARRGMSFDHRYYIRLRNGEIYGRVSADFWTTYPQNPVFGLVRLSYAVNPSGSRLLR